MDTVSFILLVPEAEQHRLEDVFNKAAVKQTPMSGDFTLPRGSAKLWIDCVRTERGTQYLVAINMQDRAEKLQLLQDVGAYYGDEESIRSRRTQGQESPSPTNSSKHEQPIPEERTGIAKREDMEETYVKASTCQDTDSEASNKQRHTHGLTFQAALSGSFLTPSPGVSLVSSTVVQEPPSDRRRTRPKGTHKKSSSGRQVSEPVPQDAFESSLGLTARTLQLPSDWDSTRKAAPRVSGSSSVAFPHLAPRVSSTSSVNFSHLNLAPRESGGTSSLAFSHSVLSSSRLGDSTELQWMGRRKEVVEKVEKEIQADVPLMTASVQTEFTWCSEEFVCYHCLFSRPPMKSGLRPSSSKGSLTEDSESSTSDCLGHRSGPAKRRRSKIYLRKVNEEMLATVWSGKLPGEKMLSDFHRTGPKLIVRSLAQLLKQWNLEYPAKVCCRYHAVISLVMFLLSCELRSNCQRAWLPNTGWQCSHCKMMHTKENHACSFCCFDQFSSDEEDAPGGGSPLSL